MSFEVPPEYIAKLDQRVAAIGDTLTQVVDAHRGNCKNHGDSASMLSFASGVEVALESDPNYVIDMLTVAVNRLSRVPKVENDF